MDAKAKKRKAPHQPPPRLPCKREDCGRISSGGDGLCIVHHADVVLQVEEVRKSGGRRPETGQHQLGNSAPSPYSSLPMLPPPPPQAAYGPPPGYNQVYGSYGPSYPQHPPVHPGYGPQGYYAQPGYYNPYNQYQPQPGPNIPVAAPAAKLPYRLEQNHHVKKEEDVDPNEALEKKPNLATVQQTEAQAFNTRVSRGTWTSQDFSKAYPHMTHPKHSWMKADVIRVIVDAWTTSDASLADKKARLPFKWSGKPEALLSEAAHSRWLRERSSYYRGLLEQPAVNKVGMSNPLSDQQATAYLAARGLEGLSLGDFDLPKDFLALWRTFQTSFECYSKTRADTKKFPHASSANSYRLAARESAEAWGKEAIDWMIGHGKSVEDQTTMKSLLRISYGRLISTVLLAFCEQVVAIQVDANRAIALTLSESGCYSKIGDLLPGKKHDHWVCSVLKEDTQRALLALHIVTTIFYKSVAWWRADLEKRTKSLTETDDLDIGPFGPILEGSCQAFADFSQPMPEFGVLLPFNFLLPEAAAADDAEMGDDAAGDGG